MNELTKGKAKVGRLIVEKLNIVTRSLGVGHADQILTNEEMKSNVLFLTGTADVGFNVIFNVAWTNFYFVINKSGQIATLKNAAGATVTVADGAVGIVQNDGTNIVTLSGLSGTAVTLTGAQTLTNKTLTSPALNTPTINGVVGMTSGSLSETAKDIAVGHADIILTAGERLTDVIKLTGAGDAGFNLVLNVDTKKMYLIDNQTGQACTIQNAAGTTIVVATTKRAIVWDDGTNIVRITADV